MSIEENTKVIQGIYEAFGRGDVAAIMSKIGTPIDWLHHGSPDIMPWPKHRRSLQEVTAFFSDLGGSVDVTKFEVRDYVAQGDNVIALGVFGGNAKSTGKPFEERWAMEWRLKDGKVVQYESYDDTAAVGSAFR